MSLFGHAIEIVPYQLLDGSVAIYNSFLEDRLNESLLVGVVLTIGNLLKSFTDLSGEVLGSWGSTLPVYIWISFSKWHCFIIAVAMLSALYSPPIAL